MITLKVSGIFGKVMEIIARRLLREAIMLANSVTDANIRGVARGAYNTVLFKPDIFCISNQLKYLPLRCIPIVIGLSLVDDLLGRIVFLCCLC